MDANIKNFSQGGAAELGNLTLDDRLALMRASVDGRIVFTTSLGLEDQAVAHSIFTQNLDIDVVTLDTARLFSETYDVWMETEERYGKKIRAVFPESSDVEQLIEDQGVNGFYDSVANRKACCNVRKVLPLNRVLEGAALWITGLRAEQSVSRSDLTFVESDDGRGLYKANPLLDWSSEKLEQHIEDNNIPINALHGKGYPSIGCQPCTRAIEPGEHERAGRWWWENDEENDEAHQECGLHVGPDGRLVRTKSVD